MRLMILRLWVGKVQNETHEVEIMVQMVQNETCVLDPMD